MGDCILQVKGLVKQHIDSFNYFINVDVSMWFLKLFFSRFNSALDSVFRTAGSCPSLNCLGKTHYIQSIFLCPVVFENGFGKFNYRGQGNPAMDQCMTSADCRPHNQCFQ